MTDVHEIDERIAKCEKILSSNPGSQIFAALAEAHRRTGDIDAAFQVCQKGLKNHPNYGSAHVVMAKINLDKGLYDWAEKEIEKAASLGGNAHAIEALRCETMLYKGETDAAISRLRKGLQADPHNGHLQKLLESAEEAGKERNKAAFPTMPEAAAPAPAAAAPRPDAPERELTASGLLKEGMALEGVFGAIHQNTNGEVLDSLWDNVTPQDKYAVVASESTRLFSEALERVKFGSCNSVLVVASTLTIYLLVRGDEHFAFFADESVNTNRMRATLSRAWQAYETHLKNRGA